MDSDCGKEIKDLKKRIRILEKKLRIAEKGRQEVERGNDQREAILKGLIDELECSRNILNQKTEHLESALEDLKSLQSKLVESEKMSALGILVAGIAHEINNPITFIAGNLKYAQEYFVSLFELVNLYEKYYPRPNAEIQAEREVIDIDFMHEDMEKLMKSMAVGVDRVSKIVLALQNFSRLGESSYKSTDIHSGIDSTLLILDNQLRLVDFPIDIIKDYGKIPPIKCNPNQLNQVFMNMLMNAIDAIKSVSNPEKSGKIQISTAFSGKDCILISFSDNGIGMTEEQRQHIFDPFFTTKPVGQGTGLGLSTAYKIVVDQHCGTLRCHSRPNEGTTFEIILPIHSPDLGLPRSGVLGAGLHHSIEYPIK